MTDSDSEIEDCMVDEVPIPKHNMFRAVRQKSSDLNDVSPSSGTSNRYAITVNISPHKLMNKKKWSTYDHSRQRLILARVEARLRKNNPSIVLESLYYETCPTLNQIHFHALYTMPTEFKAELETYYNRICSTTDAKTIKPWRHLDIQQIYNEEGWLKYIQKDQKQEHL